MTSDTFQAENQVIIECLRNNLYGLLHFALEHGIHLRKQSHVSSVFLFSYPCFFLQDENNLASNTHNFSTFTSYAHSVV